MAESIDVQEVILSGVEVSNRKRRAIVVAEDDPAMRRIIGVILRSGGFAPYMAQDGEECLNLLAKVKPQAILLDINMPRKDGITVCHEISAKFPEIQCPIIFLTARTTPEAIKFAREAGAKGFIAKPIKANDLLSRLDSILRSNVLAGTA